MKKIPIVNDIKEVLKPQFDDEQGSLNVIEFKYLPFNPKRIFWINKANCPRGNHAHYKTKHIYFCVHGKINITITDVTITSLSYELSNDSNGIYVPNMLWNSIQFSADSSLLVLANTNYDPKDYINSWSIFCRIRK